MRIEVKGLINGRDTINTLCLSEYIRNRAKEGLVTSCSLQIYFTKESCSSVDEVLKIIERRNSGRYYNKELTGYRDLENIIYDTETCEIDSIYLVKSLNLRDIIAGHIGDYMILVMEW